MFVLWLEAGQKFVQHGQITIAIDCKGLSLLIFEAKLPNYVSGPKSAPKTNSFVCVLVFCATNAAILLVYIPANIKLSFS